jgi:heterodisulfide reductase subunit A
MHRLDIKGIDQSKVGVYVCHCGINIAVKVDVAKIVEFAASLPFVSLAREYKFMCSDPGQELIQNDLKKGLIDRVVVASCSPLMHEATFRNVLACADENPYLFQMANIREHVSWVTEDKGEATRKAKALIAAATQRITLHQPLWRNKVAVHPDVLVVGGGIAGIHAALTMAEAGKRVYLVEREPTIGGHMAKFDKTFPTLDCSACILTPKMSSVKAHPNITLWTHSEVAGVTGYVGNFTVTVKRKPRYVKEDLCVGCLDCIEACVFKKGKIKDEYNQGLSLRKPVYVPFPQATPLVAVIDDKNCLYLKTGKCKRSCLEVCQRGAIDFDQKEELKTVDVGAVIVATGYHAFDPSALYNYGYGRFPNVYTSLEVERLLNASGPTAGEVILKDGSRPKAVGIIHCVGSRDDRTHRYCSKVCCMVSLKLAHLIKERTGAEIYNFYIDMRTPGKGYEEFYERLLEEKVHFIRGRAAQVTDWPMYPEETGKLVIRAEDTLMAMIRRIPVDMVVLSVGLEPGRDGDALRRLFNINSGSDGWLLERHPKLAPVSTATEGIFLAGACQGPKDIPESVAQAGAAAAEAVALIDKGYVELEPNTVFLKETLCCGCKTCTLLCPYKALGFDENKKVATVNQALCKGCGTCSAACPTGALTQNLFTSEQIMSEIGGLLSYV